MKNAEHTSVAAIIVAAGRGERAGGDIPKQWQQLGPHRVIDWTINAFRECPRVSEIVVVVHENDRDYLEDADLTVVSGGKTRAASVKAGLEALETAAPWVVLIHDAARACVTQEVISNVIEALDTSVAAAPGLPVTDAVWQAEGQHVIGEVDRTHLVRAQTPQGFHFETILAAHRTEHAEGAADDVEIARKSGHSIAITPGHADNIKITRPDDFARAERILRSRMEHDIRVGNGFDVHRFTEGDHVILCGIAMPHSRALKGHSDADVGLHTVTDAIYGALAEGDIGRHFPPSDPQWKGADSRVFLEHAVALAGRRGYRISNVDLTFMCERPKIGPHAPEMMQNLSSILDIALDRVSVKATTTEQLGFTGREEGIAAMATVTLVRP